MPKPIARMPLLLRRALAQLNGDPPQGWPNAQRAEPPERGAPYSAELYSPTYPFPALAIPDVFPHLCRTATRAELRLMLTKLQKANIGSAWRALEARCAKATPIPKDPGLEVLAVLIEALVPVNAANQRSVKKGAERIKAAAHELVMALDAFKDLGAPLRGVMPTKPTELPVIADIARRFDHISELNWTTPKARTPFAGIVPTAASAIMCAALTTPDVLLALLRSLAERDLGSIPQRRGTMAQRRAMTIARRLIGVTGAGPATAIANAATGARITERSARSGSRK